MSKENLVHVCFIIDESGSMGGSESDVIGGFKKVIKEQRENKNGGCSVSFYKFATNVQKVYMGIDVQEVEYLDGKYSPGGMTALYDGIGTAIDDLNDWMDDLPKEERPEKTVVVIMTDGEENNSHKYNLAQIKRMIKHQEKGHEWTFVYMGSDLSNAKEVDNLGISTRCFSSKKNYINNYDIINSSVSAYRSTCGDAGEKGLAFTSSLNIACNEATVEYANENNLDLNSLVGKDSE